MALTSVSELQTLIHEHITRTPRLPEVEHIPVAQSIGRVLAEDMVSALNIPATDMSAMDGYALPSAAAAGSRLANSRRSCRRQTFYQQPTERRLHPYHDRSGGSSDCTCIVLQEHTETDGNTVAVTQDVAVGANIRYGGEEVANRRYGAYRRPHPPPCRRDAVGRHWYRTSTGLPQNQSSRTVYGRRT